MRNFLIPKTLNVLILLRSVWYIAITLFGVKHVNKKWTYFKRLRNLEFFIDFWYEMSMCCLWVIPNNNPYWANIINWIKLVTGRNQLDVKILFLCSLVKVDVMWNSWYNLVCCHLLQEQTLANSYFCWHMFLGQKTFGQLLGLITC